MYLETFVFPLQKGIFKVTFFYSFHLSTPIFQPQKWFLDIQKFGPSLTKKLKIK